MTRRLENLMDANEKLVTAPSSVTLRRRERVVVVAWELPIPSADLARHQLLAEAGSYGASVVDVEGWLRTFQREPRMLYHHLDELVDPIWRQWCDVAFAAHLVKLYFLERSWIGPFDDDFDEEPVLAEEYLEQWEAWYSADDEDCPPLLAQQADRWREAARLALQLRAAEWRAIADALLIEEGKLDRVGAGFVPPEAEGLVPPKAG